MGLRCLLGHDFAEPTTEREREERGDEVIVAVRRVKECRRCGETRVVSENKEVTSMAQPLGGSEGTESGSGSAASDAAGASDSPASSTSDWADDDRSLIADAESGAEFDHPEADLDGVDTDVEDDAEIIRSGSSDADDAGRGRGEWPDADVNRDFDRSTGVAQTDDTDDGPAGAGATETGGATADPADEDAEFIDADAEAGADVDAGDERVPWPDHDGEDEGFDATFGEADDADTAETGTDDDAGGEYIEAESEPLDGEPVGSTGGGAGGSRWGASNESTESTGPSEPSGSNRSDRTDEASGSAASAAPGVELRTTSDDPDAEYVCPECGMREPVGASSTRAGDICPECKRGYVEERELE